MTWQRRHVLATDDWSRAEIEQGLQTTAAMGGDLAGKRIVIVGDITHSRVARSDIDALVPLGATITLAGPPTLVPSAWRCGMTPRGTTYEPDLDEALDGADAVIALRLQTERQHAGLLPSIREYAHTWGLSEERVARMRPDAPVLHPGPMNEGVEIAASVAHGSRSLIETQVTNGVAVRMALLYLLAAGPDQKEQKE